MLRELLSDTDFRDRLVRICLGDECRVFTFVEPAGGGKKGTIWKVRDRFGQPFYALKLVPKADYSDHSLEAEIQKTKRLRGPFARIETYGTLQFDDPGLEEISEGAYAIVVEWIDGLTLEDYCTENVQLNVPEFLRLAEQLCESLAILVREGLCHNDLHSKNVMIMNETAGLTQEEEAIVRIVDTGSLKTLALQDALIRRWRTEIEVLERRVPDDPVAAKLRDWVNWFSRSDQEWVVCHLCALVNLVRRNESSLPGAQRRFLRKITSLLDRMVDPDHSMRLDEPLLMYRAMEDLWKTESTPTTSRLASPFDLISAELIRSDKRLNELFSRECPWFKESDTSYPVYMYGPRGCGKSTVLRMLALPAVLAGEHPKEVFSTRPYLGVYLSCSSELRSRFWLFPEERYEDIAAEAILFFTMLLVEALLDTLELLRDGVVETYLGHGESVGLTNDTARQICSIICNHFDLDHVDRLRGVSWILYARKALALKRTEVWQRILTSPSRGTPNPSLLFDVCKDVAEVFPLLKEKHLAFLLDDYSNQRIPLALQRMLNQTISFAKQGNPIFKVSSEYQGVDLEGIQEGREVVEINFGKEYVDLTDRKRSAFLEDVLNIRFTTYGLKTRIGDVLDKSTLGPGVPMARKIKQKGKGFYYYGIDTIADICSGDLAMALDLVKRICLRYDLASITEPIPPREQHEVIHKYSDREHEYLRHYSPYGKEMSDIADALSWLAHEAAMKCLSKKEGVADEPMVKTHLDIGPGAMRDLTPEQRDMLMLLQKKGILFSLDTSRTRYENRGTERFQLRRILLVKYLAPLGRRDAIKIDQPQKLVFLLTEPHALAQSELTGQRTLYQGK